jgi:hypothetical protein
VSAPKLSVRAPTDAERGKGGVFALQPIAAMEVVARIPRRLVLSASDAARAAASEAREPSWATELTAEALLAVHADGAAAGTRAWVGAWKEGGWATNPTDLGNEEVRWGARDVTGSLIATGSDNDKNIYAKFRTSSRLAPSASFMRHCAGRCAAAPLLQPRAGPPLAPEALCLSSRDVHGRFPVPPCRAPRRSGSGGAHRHHVSARDRCARRARPSVPCDARRPSQARRRATPDAERIGTRAEGMGGRRHCFQGARPPVPFARAIATRPIASHTRTSPLRPVPTPSLRSRPLPSQVLARATNLELDGVPTSAVVPLHERLAHCDSRGENTKLVGADPTAEHADAAVLLVATREILPGEPLTRDYTLAPRLPDDASDGALRLVLQFGLPPDAWPREES